MKKDMMKKEWTNWSEDVRFTPGKVVTPANEDELIKIIRNAGQHSSTIRAIGSRHSCSPIFKTEDILLSPECFNEFYAGDHDKLSATVGAAMTVEETGNALHPLGLALENTGHIDKQTMAGAISTGTHGAGKRLSNLSGQVTGLRMVNGQGAVKEYNEQEHPEMMQALRVSLGAMGIFTRIRIKVLPSYRLHRKQYCASTDDCLQYLEQLMDENRNFCFYWYPRRDDISIRLWNEPGEGTLSLPFKAHLYKEYCGWSKDVLPSRQELKFNELEYSIDTDKAKSCFQEVRHRIRSRHRHIVGWRVLFRPVAGDNNYMSNTYGSNKVAITIHQNATLPYTGYFNDIESVFQAYGGRPHWAKKHTMSADELQKLYPMWHRFHEIRKEMDPENIFLNSYLQRVLFNR